MLHVMYLMLSTSYDWANERKTFKTT